MMRFLALVGTVSALLTGCASGESAQSGPAVAGKADDAHAHHGPAAAEGPQHPHSFSETVPVAYHGVFEGSLQACSRPSGQRLTVSASQLRFQDRVGSVRNVAFGGTGAIAVEADYEGEGERGRSLRILRLFENGTKLNVKGEGGSLDRVRCPAGAR
jgi:hypothetical protein